MTNRQPKLPLAFRIVAAACVVLWLAGVSACNLESLFCCAPHGSEADANTDIGHSHPEHAAAATPARHTHPTGGHHSHDVGGHSHKHESKKGTCCSTLKAVVQNAKPPVFTKQTFLPIPCLSIPVETRAFERSLVENLRGRQAKARSRVFTPEVCLGPAHRSHAPPASPRV